MKRFTLLIFLLFGFFDVFSQNISVKSFKALPMDMTASSLEGKRIDQNGQVAALIKVMTTEKGFVFEGGALGIVDTQQRVGEIWVWVPQGLRKITILHQQLDGLRDYRFPENIEAERTYEMVLTTAKIETIVKEEVRQQYLAFKITPSNAILEVDDELWTVDGDGTAMKYVDFGTYTYRVRAANFFSEAGQIIVDDPDSTKLVTVTLKPDFAEITLKVDADAEIWVNNEKKGVRSWTGPLGKGVYKIECKQAGHEATMISQEINTEMNGQTIMLTAPRPIYGMLMVESTPNFCKLKIDGKEMGTTPKSINEILIGQHEISLSKEGYDDYNETITIVKGDRKQVRAALTTSNTKLESEKTKQKETQLQESKQSTNGFSFGFKLGPVFDWIGSTTGAAKDEGMEVGFGLGVVAEYDFAKNYAIVSGVNVNMNRGHYSFDNARLVMGADSVAVPEIYSIDRYYKSTIYEVPLMLKMMTNELGNLPLRAYAQVGAGLGYSQRVKVKDDNADEYSATNKEYSNLRVSLKIGAGAKYAIGESTCVFAGVYFSHDFINNINSTTPNYYKYYNGDKDLGERETRLNVLQNHIGIEVGVLF